MKVKELIKELKKYDGELPITVGSDSIDLFSFEITDIWLTSVYKENDYVELYGNPTENWENYEK